MKDTSIASWAYCISQEKVLKRLLEKELIPKEDAEEIRRSLFEKMTEQDINEFRITGGCAEAIRTYLKADAENNEYISLTDIARKYNNENPGYVIQSWLRSRNIIELLRIWEKEHNPIFNDVECNTLLEEIKSSSFTLTPKLWISRTESVGLISKQGKNGGTLAHPDIAIDFHMWVNPELRLNLIKIFRKSGCEDD